MIERSSTVVPSAAAVILAGGRAQRMGGVVKSELSVGGERLLDRVAARLRACHPILVSHGRHEAAALRLAAELVPVADLDADYAGPLAGLCGAVEWLTRSEAEADLLVSVAVDTPFLPDDYVSRLVSAVGEGAVAVASYAGQVYPTNAVWRLARLRDLPERVRRGTAPHSLKRLAAEAGATLVDWSMASEANPFDNANTPEELAALRERAATAKPSSG